MTPYAKTTATAAAVALVLGRAGAVAQEVPAMHRTVSITQSEVHPISSRHAEADFELWIAEPFLNPRVPKPERLPVLYVTDADLWFGTATEMTRIMHGLFGELPPIFVVGIAYGTTDPAVQGEIRNRDLTPSADPGFEAMARQMDPNWEPLLPEGRRMGRAEEFLTFIVDEVKPFVAGRFSVDPENEAVFGASLGGLFVLHALLSRPDSFEHYIASSPAIWWDGEMLFDVEEGMASSVTDVEASLYLGVGELEEGVGLPWLDRFRTVTNVARMAERLSARSYPSLKLAHQVFSGETHTTVVPAVLTRGLRMAFRGTR